MKSLTLGKSSGLRWVIPSLIFMAFSLGMLFLLPAKLTRAGSVWNLQSTTSGFEWVSPAGAKVCKYAGVSLTDDSFLTYPGNTNGVPPQFTNAVPAKYPDWDAWARTQDSRLRSWGFNAAGMYSGRFSGGNHPADGLPYENGEGSSLYAMNQAPYVKNMWRIENPSGMVCGTRIYPGLQADPFDPNAQSAYNKVLTNFTFGSWSNIMVGLPEEADYLFGLNTVDGTHADLAFIAAANNPMMKRGSAEIGSPTYTDTMLYTKTALRDYLAQKYGCAGSADPAAVNYCGASQAASALTALNNAWFGSQIYTSWNTTDPAGLTGIHNGTYAAWGSGTGFLDENGSHILSSTQKLNCGGAGGSGPANIDNWGASAQIKTDLQAFVAHFAGTYARIVRTAYYNNCGSSCPPMFFPVYDGPSYVYQAMAPYADGFWVSPFGLGLNNVVSEVKRIIAAASIPGGKSTPIILGDYATANPDSQFSSSIGGGALYPSQSAKGSGLVSLWQSILHLQDINGKYVVVGLEHWPFYDQANEKWDGGLVSSDADNPYDGSATNIAASKSTLWQANHAYTAPSIIFDGTNFQALSGGITTSCTSGNTIPVWAARNGSATRDGTCLWRNEGPYPLKPEPAVGASATIPGKAYGDAVTPIANFLNAGICDPGATSTPPDTTPPSIPTGLNASPVSPSQINLVWSASSDPTSAVSGYYVYRNGTRVGGASTVSYSDTGLSPATTYTYNVAAYDPSGNISGQSASASATTFTSGGSSATSTSAVVLRASSLASNRVTNSVSENISLPAVVNGDIVIVQLVLMGSPTNTNVIRPVGYATVSEAASDGTYNTFEGIYWHKWSTGDPTSVTFAWTNPAAPVWSVSAWSGANQTNPIDNFAYGTTSGRTISHAAPSLSLSTTSDAVLRFSGLETYYGNMFTTYPAGFAAIQTQQGDGVIPNLYLGVMSNPANPTGISTLISGIATYSVNHIVALRPAAASPPLQDTTAPTVPTGLTAAPISSTQINLAWTPSTDPNSAVAGYNVYRNGTKIGASSLASYSDTGLSANTTYSYAVSAYDPSGNTSNQSAVVSATTQASSTARFYVGQRVTATAALNVRRQACTTGKIVGVAAQGAFGTVASGPKKGCGYTWWNVNWANGLKGWSAENFLAPAPIASGYGRTQSQIPVSQTANISGNLGMQSLIDQLRSLEEQLRALLGR